MGYRSDVQIIIEFQSEEEVKETEVNLLINNPKILEYVNKYFDKYKTRYVYEEESVKWYSDYEDVDKITKVFRFFSAYENLNTSFSRIGEDMNDIEVENYGDDYIGGVSTYFVDTDHGELRNG